MSLFPFAIISLAVYALIHFYWIPKADKKIQSSRGPDSIPQIAWRSGLSVGGAVALVAAITTFAIILLVSILNWQGGADVDTVTAAMKSIQGWREWLSGFSPAWGVLAIILLTVGLVLHARWRSKVKFNTIFNKMFEAEYTRFAEAKINNQLPFIPPNENMVELGKQMGEIEYYLDHLDEVPLPKGQTKEGFVKQLEAVREDLYKRHFALDVARRIDVKLDEEEIALPEPKTMGEKIQTFFFSKGLVNNINRSSRLVYLLCLLLLVPSLMGLHAGTVQGEMDQRIVQLENIQIDLEGAQSEEELAQQIEQLGNPTHNLSDEDLEVIDQAAELYEESVAQAVMAGAGLSAASAYAIRSNLVRDRILTRYQATSTSKLEKMPSGARAGSLRKVETEALEVAEKALNGQKTRIDQKNIVRTELKKAAQRRPGLIRRLKNEIQSFQTPAKAKDISRSLARHTIGTAISGSGQSEFGAVVNEAMKGQSARRLQSVSEANSRNYVKNILQGDGLETACDKAVKSAQVEQLKPLMRNVASDVRIGEIPNKLQNYPPTVKNTPEPHVKMNNATSRVVNMSNRGMRGNAQFADALSGFSDYFPEQLDADSKTPRGRARQSITGKAPSSYRTASSFSRSRSFVRMRGFSRIGGVLIGIDDPQSGTQSTFTDIGWEINGRNIRLKLTDTKGGVFQSKWHPLPIAYQALNYAADGRPVAVTMVTAPPMQELRILCHPTLIDTPLGYYMIELDRFVDQFTGDDYRRQKATQTVYDIHHLYEITWANRAMVLIREYTSQAGSQGGTELMQFAMYIGQIIEDPEKRIGAARALRNPEILSDPRQSPIISKTDFYESALVRSMQQAASSANSLQAFEKSIQNMYERQSSNEDWVSNGPPEFQVWSGVREREFSVTGSDLIMQTNDDKGALSFMLQVAFTSAPLNMDEDQAAAYVDEAPWEFPSLGQHIENEVRQELQKTGDERTIYRHAAEFTMLQRLFRMAFNNRLGEQFPIEKLVDLAEELENKTPKKGYRTLRWNAFPGFEAQMRAMMNEDNREDIQEIIDLRRDLGVEVDEKQVANSQGKGIPSLY